MIRAVFAALFCLFPLFAAAQERPNTILVLDASGSMWGQIDGVNKIVIAREVIGDLLGTLPEELNLGLYAYGHRRKGDCSDIEMLYAPGTDRAAIAAAVNRINPRGKTPLSAAVIQAAESLKYTEERATVILVSDGIETCNLDPCAVGRQLEEAGIDFTAHVIGFAVDDPAARAQLQCLAEETGGIFRTAADATELTSALEEVAAPPPPPPPPSPVTVTLRALDGAGGPQITGALVWDLTGDAGGAVLTAEQAASPSVELLPGRYTAEVLRPADEATATLSFTVTDADTTQTLVLPEFLPLASLDAPASAPAGSMVAVLWSGPGAQSDYIVSATPRSRAAEYHSYTYTRDSDGDVLMLRMPPEPGQYELRYILEDGRKILATRMIEVTPLIVTLGATDQAVAGESIPVDWVGPDYENDYLTVAVAASGDREYVNYTYTREGSPLDLVMPPEPGNYEIRYVLNASKHVVARRAITVVEARASLSAPESAAAGGTVQVTWEGPAYDNDYISVAKIGARDNQYEGYEYTRKGNPAELTMPLEPGNYELRYVLNQDHTVLARRAITVTEIGATLEADAVAPANGEITVHWTGPGYQNDYVDIALLGSRANEYETYEYTRKGSPLVLQVPTQPGDYEIRYIASGNPRVILARTQLTVQAVGASIVADREAPAGSTLPVFWSGPGGQNDFIAVAQPGARVSAYEAYEYTRVGTPLNLEMPTIPGEYELRYIVQGTERQILAREPITITPVGATLHAPDTAPAGSELVVDWTGPGYRNDYVAIALPEERANKYVSYEYTRDGSPLRVKVPPDPGVYELRYIMQGTERVIVTSRPLVVEPVTATIEADATAAAGKTLIVHWTGPGYRNDYVCISRVGDSKYETYEYARSGSPLALSVPSEPGAYEIRYVMGEGRKILTAVPLEVK